MKRNLFVKSILLLLVATLTGCNSEENTLSESDQLLLVSKAIAKAPVQIAEKEDLPEWLSEFIDSLAPDNIRKVAAYQARWNGEDVYYVWDEYFSCFTCATFTADGRRFDWSEVDSKEFWESATDWKCIYLCENKILDI